MSKKITSFLCRAIGGTKREVVFFAQECDNIILEGDSVNVMKLISDTGDDFESFDPVQIDIKIISRDFRYFKMSSVRRFSNKVAYNLARKAVSISCFDVWEEEATDFLVPSFSRIFLIYQSPTI